MTDRGEKRLIAGILMVSGGILVVWGALAGSPAIMLLDVPAGILFTGSGVWLFRRNARRRSRKSAYD